MELQVELMVRERMWGSQCVVASHGAGSRGRRGLQTGGGSGRESGGAAVNTQRGCWDKGRSSLWVGQPGGEGKRWVIGDLD